MDRWTRRSFLAAGLSLGACARLDRPPLGALYRPTRETLEQPPLIVIPGAFGSCLRDRRSGREIWPGSSAALVTSRYLDLEVAIDPATLEPRTDDVEAYDIFAAGLGRDFYGQVLQTLEQVGGYVRCGECSLPRADRRNYYIYPYDFRLDNVRSVRGLHELIERIRADYGDPRLQVDILAHSNGGLLARYYARYGGAELPESGPFHPTGEGAPAIRRLLLVGTPNLGTIQPVLSHLRGEEVVLRKIPHEVIATFTGAPQIMPHPAVPWLLDVKGRPLDHSLYDIATWRALGWSLFDETGRRAATAAAPRGGPTWRCCASTWPSTCGGGAASWKRCPCRRPASSRRCTSSAATVNSRSPASWSSASAPGWSVASGSRTSRDRCPASTTRP